MSRIGNAPIIIPEGVEINISTENMVSVKGKLGELKEYVNPSIKVEHNDGIVSLSRSSDDKEIRSMHGLYRSLINNMEWKDSDGNPWKSNTTQDENSIINNPQIILADEPTGSLDMSTAKDIFKLLTKQKRSDRIIIFATHNRFFAKKADYLLEMKDGSIKSSNA